MKTVADVLEQIIMESPFLEEGLAEGIINLSALARKVRPQIERELMKSLSDAAVVMALKRMRPAIVSRVSPGGGLRSLIRDLTVRSELSELTFLKSATLVEKQRELLGELARGSDRFVIFTQGVFEVTAIFEAGLLPVAEKVFSGERILARFDRVAAITIRLVPEAMHTPGVHYSVLKQLALRGINVLETVSTYTEFNVVLEREVVNRAFSILLELSSPETGPGPERQRR